jgi:hypothetical protein
MPRGNAQEEPGRQEEGCQKEAEGIAFLYSSVLVEGSREWDRARLVSFLWKQDFNLCTHPILLIASGWTA